MTQAEHPCIDRASASGLEDAENTGVSQAQPRVPQPAVVRPASSALAAAQDPGWFGAMTAGASCTSEKLPKPALKSDKYDETLAAAETNDCGTAAFCPVVPRPVAEYSCGFPHG